MSNKRLLTATIDGNTYELGEQYVLGKATTNNLGGIKVGASINSAVSCTTPSGDVKNYAVNIDGNGMAYVKIPSTSNTNIATTTTHGTVRIPTNGGLTIDNNGSLKVNLKEGNGISTSQSDNSNPSYLKLDTATDNSLGGIKTGYANSSFPNNYGIKLDSSSGKAYVEVPIQSITKDIDTLTPNVIKINSDYSIVGKDRPGTTSIDTNNKSITLNNNCNNNIYYIGSGVDIYNIIFDLSGQYLNPSPDSEGKGKHWKCTLTYEKPDQSKNINFLFMGTTGMVNLEEYFNTYFNNGGKANFLTEFKNNGASIVDIELFEKARYISTDEAGGNNNLVAGCYGNFFISLKKYINANANS